MNNFVHELLCSYGMGPEMKKLLYPVFYSHNILDIRYLFFSHTK